MIFETLVAAADKGELLLVDGGLCHWHLRRDGQLTIYELIVLPERRRQGIGRRILGQLKGTPGAASILARCPANLDANAWYERMGFAREGTETTRTGRQLNLWRLRLSSC